MKPLYTGTFWSTDYTRTFQHSHTRRLGTNHLAIHRRGLQTPLEVLCISEFINYPPHRPRMERLYIRRKKAENREKPSFYFSSTGSFSSWLWCLSSVVQHTVTGHHWPLFLLAFSNCINKQKTNWLSWPGQPPVVRHSSEERQRPGSSMRSGWRRFQAAIRGGST